MGLDVGAGFGNLTAIAVAAYNASGDSGPLSGFGGVTAIRAHLIVTARTGTNPTLDVVIEDTLDGTNYISLGSFTQKTAAANEGISIVAPTGDRIRVRYTIGGTASPTFTFGVYLIAK